MSPRVLVIALAGCAAGPPAPSSVQVAVVPDDAPVPRMWRPGPVAPFEGGASLLLTDGTVMTQQVNSEQWWRLTPDEFGSYEHGTWTARASAPSGYSPLYFASSVLVDGRVIVEGGEYIDGNQAFSTQGAIYDPVGDSWTRIAPPDGWQTIGDAEGIVLPNGTFMLSDCCSTNLALLEPGNLLWSAVGGDKEDINDEESWTLLPDDTILTVDANNVARPRTSEIYSPVTQLWTNAGDTPVQISDLGADGSGSHEIGPEVLRADGTVLAIGAKGQNVLYDTATKTWSRTADLPIVNGNQFGVADGPAALMPSGDVLVAASPGVFGIPTLFYEFDGTAFTLVDEPNNAPGDSSFNNFMLLLPTGEVWLSDFSTDIELYTPAKTITQNAVPVITAITPVATATQSDGWRPELLPLTTLNPGFTYELAGTQLAGISMGAYYGDDDQSSTNYALVRLTNLDTQHVVYCRTHHHGTRSIAPNRRSTTQFDVPATAERGEATLEAVTNGIASPAVLVNVK